MRKLKNLFIIFGSFFILVFSSPSLAQDDLEFDKFRASFGWFNPRADTTIRADATNFTLGTTIKLEDDVGLAKGRGLFRIDGYYRPKKRHRIDFGYYDFERKGQKNISLVILYGDTTFPTNTQVNSFFDIKIFKIAYTYLIVANEKTNLGVSIGFNISEMDAGLVDAITPLSQSVGTKLPVPVVGINGSHNLGHNFFFEGHVQFFYLDIGNYDGQILDARVAVNYRIKDNFGIGVGYNFFNIKVNKNNPNFTGRMGLKFKGVQIFATLFF